MSSIVEMGFDALTVSEIRERADVGRTVFYTHYDRKDDLSQGSVARSGEVLRRGVVEASARSRT